MTAVPYNQFTSRRGAHRGRRHRDPGLPPRCELPGEHKQQQLTLFIRATKPGEDTLAGVSTRRLVAITSRADVRPSRTAAPEPFSRRGRRTRPSRSREQCASSSEDLRAPDEETLRGRDSHCGVRVSRAASREPAAGPACGRGMPPSTPCQGGTKDPPWCREVRRHRARMGHGRCGRRGRIGHDWVNPTWQGGGTNRRPWLLIDA